MTNLPEELVAWPEKPSADDCAVYGQHAFTTYHRARADAAIARLQKLHHAATRFMRSTVAAKHADYGSVDCIAEALAAIGPLPPPPEAYKP